MPDKKQSEAFLRYKETFPSDTFIRKHLGFSPIRKGLWYFDLWVLVGKRRTVPQTLHEVVHSKMDSIFRCYPMDHIRHADRYPTDLPIQPLYVFEHGKCSETIREVCEAQGFYFTPTTEAALCREFIAQYHQRALHQDEWWEWFTEGDSIGVRLKPDANPHGGNEPRRTLEEFFGTNADFPPTPL